MKTKGLLLIILYFCLCLMGCKNKEVINKEAESKNTNILVTVSPKPIEDKMIINNIPRTENSGSNDKAEDKTSDVDTLNNDMINIKSIFEDLGYSLDADEYIADTEWLPSEQYQCLRIIIDYIEQPEDGYQHKADYFIFYDDTKVNIKDVLNVNYTDKWLGSGNDFDSYFQDITFDGKEDLIISLGDSGASRMYCAYIYGDTGFKYEPTYSNIPSPEIDNENKTINGWSRDSAASYTDYIYSYNDSKFECNKKSNYEWNPDKEAYELQVPSSY